MLRKIGWEIEGDLERNFFVSCKSPLWWLHDENNGKWGFPRWEAVGWVQPFARGCLYHPQRGSSESEVTVGGAAPCWCFGRGCLQMKQPGFWFTYICVPCVYSASLNRRQPRGISETQRASSTRSCRDPCGWHSPASLMQPWWPWVLRVPFGSQRPCISQYNSPHFLRTPSLWKYWSHEYITKHVKGIAYDMIWINQKMYSVVTQGLKSK